MISLRFWTCGLAETPLSNRIDENMRRLGRQQKEETVVEAASSFKATRPRFHARAAGST